MFPGLVPGLWNHFPDRDTRCCGIPYGLQPTEFLADPKVVVDKKNLRSACCIWSVGRRTTQSLWSRRWAGLTRRPDTSPMTSSLPPWRWDSIVIVKFFYNPIYITCQLSWFLCRRWTSYLGTSVWSSTYFPVYHTAAQMSAKKTNWWLYINLNILCKKQHG